MSLLHIAHVTDWSAAAVTGEYRVSTRGASLEQVGFIHASSSAQVAGVADFAYRDDPEGLVVLVIDDEVLREAGIAVRYQDGGNGTLFPHIFGALRPEFVTEVRPAGFVNGVFAWLREGRSVDCESLEGFEGTIAETDVAGAVAAERRLLDPAVRRDRAAVDSLLAPEFSEIGQSGRLWERTELLDAIVEFESSAGLLVTELEARVPAPDLVLLGYVSTVGESRVRRSSLWRHAADRWRVEFHQGTPLSRSV
ncbi:DUF952 domain-containing protein [Glaciihabitans sp. INWT7]|uniref:DUF952 domain-containing protein n=1 Tax=Glaciihabitans sp. INWT7 TaxID=2596912 RepID=UPI001CA56B7E|nr:DUF952 domain-containing protein [Glaciihabitans sp. INWT7]